MVVLGLGLYDWVAYILLGILIKYLVRWNYTNNESFLFLFVLFLLLGEVGGVDELLLLIFWFFLDFLWLLEDIEICAFGLSSEIYEVVLKWFSFHCLRNHWLLSLYRFLMKIKQLYLVGL